jgi:phage terminase large subunit-like protein
MPQARQVLEQYVDDVLAGTRCACLAERQACERHRRDVAAGIWRFDDAELDDVCEFCAWCRHWKGQWAGQPFVPEPWQVFVLGSILCWKDPATQLRRFAMAYVEVPRKNGKSWLASVVGCYLFFADGEAGAEIYTAATKEEQARIVHNDAKRIVQASPQLRRHVDVQKSVIYARASGSVYKPLGSDSKTQDGLNVHGALIDEFHAHPSDELFSVINNGTGSRRQPLIFIITTAGYLLAGPCKMRHDQVLDVLAGRITDDHLFGFIAAAEPGDDWRSEDVWRKANPNFGVSCNPEDLRRKCVDAQNLTTLQNDFLTKRLNLWVGQAERWIDMEEWRRCHEQATQPLAGRRVFGGMDLSSTTDITAVVWVADDAEAQCWDVHARLFIPRDNAIARERRDRVPYRAWADAGWIKLTEGNVVDYDVVRARILGDAGDCDLAELAFDPWAATQIANDLAAEEVPLIAFRQGYASMSEPAKTLERLIKQGRLRLGGNPVLQWMASNVAIETDAAGNIKPSKAKSQERIDGIVALIMALGRACLAAEDPGSVYEHRGLITL